jgi:anaerobic ribonucleoside-triphosphate reductase activating protein
MRCAGCCNPDFLVFEDRSLMLVDEIVADILADQTEGVSLLGGEPFSQADALADVAEAVRAAGRTVMVYTGHTMAEIRALPGDGPARLVAATDLLVDGRYDASLRTTNRRWVGSENQVIHFLSDRYRPDDPCFSEPNHLEIRIVGGVVSLNGWPALGAATRVAERTRKP